MVDRDELGTDTLSTHTIFPNTLARLDDLGLLERLLERHDLPLLNYRLRVLGRETVGTFTPIGASTGPLAPRRVTARPGVGGGGARGGRRGSLRRAGRRACSTTIGRSAFAGCALASG